MRLEKGPSQKSETTVLSDIPHDGVLVTILVSHSFSCFHDFKLGPTISMAPRMVSFDLVFCQVS